jgi:hypothetical protein
VANVTTPDLNQETLLIWSIRHGSWQPINLLLQAKSESKLKTRITFDDEYQ